MLVSIIGCGKSAAEEYLTQMFDKKITIPPSGKINNYLWQGNTLYKVVEENNVLCETIKPNKKQNADTQYCFDF
jgi:hypothetical protein